LLHQQDMRGIYLAAPTRHAWHLPCCTNKTCVASTLLHQQDTRGIYLAAPTHLTAPCCTNTPYRT